MSFEGEWAGLKADAAARMQLNSAPAEGPGAGPSGGDLVIHDDELGRIGHFAYRLHNNLKADGKHARTTTEAAGASLASDGFEMGKVLTAAPKGTPSKKELGDTRVEAPAEPGKVRYR
jgi:hypothetical protein